jgi:hypothetical protein
VKEGRRRTMYGRKEELEGKNGGAYFIKEVEGSERRRRVRA